MFEKYMIVTEKVSNKIKEGNAVGFEFEARLPYYRGVSLSMVEEIEVGINGNTLPQENVHITVHGNTYNLHDRENQMEDRWEMGEVASLFVEYKGGLPAGEHELSLKINLRIGYMPFPSIRNASKKIKIV